MNGGTKGGLVGYINSADRNNILSAYYNSSKSSCSDIDKGTPLTDENLKLPVSFVGWDFEKDWAVTPSINDGYPYLRELAPEAIVDVTGVSLDKTSLSLDIDASETLTATVLPANASNVKVTWTSSDNAVATVENGLVKAVGEGTATITVTTEDGKFTAECVVTVKDSSFLFGDVNGDGLLDLNDAIRVLQYSMFPELYPLEYEGNVDFTGDGVVDVNDAILLLQHSMFPELYPIA